MASQTPRLDRYVIIMPLTGIEHPSSRWPYAGPVRGFSDGANVAIESAPVATNNRRTSYL